MKRKRTDFKENHRELPNIHKRARSRQKIALKNTMKRFQKKQRSKEQSESAN